MAIPRKRKSPQLVPGYERVPGHQRHYRVIETGQEISRRQYQQQARGYQYEKIARGRARERARRSWLEDWIAKVRAKFFDFAGLTKTRILRELRKMGMVPPHHGKRKPSPGEAAKEQAFLDFMGYTKPAAAQLYPTLETGTETMEGAIPSSAARPADPSGTSPSTMSSPARSTGRIRY